MNNIPQHHPEQFLTVAEAAQIARLHAQTIRSAIRSGSLKAKRAGRLIRIPKSEFDAWMSR